MFDSGDLIDDFETAIERNRDHVARKLLSNALILQAEHKKKLSVANPRPYKHPAPKNTYPKARTYNLRDAVVVEPSSLKQIRSLGYVITGILLGAWYGAILKKLGWKGLADTHAALVAAGAYR